MTEENKPKKYYFTEADERSSQEVQIVKDCEMAIDMIFAIHRVDIAMGLTVMFDMFEKGSFKVYRDLPTADAKFEAMRGLLNDFIDARKKMYTEYIEQKAAETPLSMHCTLCDTKKENMPRTIEGLLRFPKNATRIETEGCPFCYKGMGRVIHAATIYDKDNKIIVHHAGNELHKHTTEDIQKIFDSL